MINCMRCQKEIVNANKHNAKYITNISDVRTHGPRKKTVFKIIIDGAVYDNDNKLEKAKEKHAKEVQKKQKKIDNKKKEVDTLYEELSSIENIPGNQTAINLKSAKINVKSNDLRVLYDERAGVRLVSEIETETVAKTAIICLDSDCQYPTDKIIW